MFSVQAHIFGNLHLHPKSGPYLESNKRHLFVVWEQILEQKMKQTFLIKFTLPR